MGVGAFTAKISKGCRIPDSGRFSDTRFLAIFVPKRYHSRTGFCTYCGFSLEIGKLRTFWGVGIVVFSNMKINVLFPITTQKKGWSEMQFGSTVIGLAVKPSA